MMSVLLPTIRPALIENCLLALSVAMPTNAEVIVVADFPRTSEIPTQWLVRPRRGTVDAINEAYRAAVGDVVFLTNDEAVVAPDALTRLEAEIARDDRQLLSPRHVPAFPFVYYGRPFAAFPCASKAFINEINDGTWLLDPAYRAFYADPDLSMKVHAAGLPVCEVHDAVLTHFNNQGALGHQENISAYLAADRQTFGARWAHFGELVDP